MSYNASLQQWSQLLSTQLVWKKMNLLKCLVESQVLVGSNVGMQCWEYNIRLKRRQLQLLQMRPRKQSSCQVLQKWPSHHFIQCRGQGTSLVIHEIMQPMSDHYHYVEILLTSLKRQKYFESILFRHHSLNYPAAIGGSIAVASANVANPAERSLTAVPDAQHLIHHP